MVIKKYYTDRQKPGYQYDRKEHKYFSWGYDIWRDGQRYQERGFFTQEKCEAAVKAIREADKHDTHGTTPKADSPFLIELFQKKLDATTVRRDRTRAKRVFKDFLALLPPNIKVKDLKKAHLQSYIDKRAADGVKNSTIKREMVPIIAVLNNADAHFAELEGFSPPKKPKLAIPKTRNNVTIQHEQRAKLLNYLLGPAREGERAYQTAARRRTGLFLQFCLLTASRPGETAGIRKSDIDLHTGVITIRGTKTANKVFSDRKLPITETMRAILIERMELNPDREHIFTRNGGSVTGKMREQLKAVCEAVGIKYGRHTLDGIVFYTARHTATTVLQHSNRVDIATTGEFTGHADETMTMYYTHTNPETLRIAGEVLEENMGNFLLTGEFPESLEKTGSSEKR